MTTPQLPALGFIPNPVLTSRQILEQEVPSVPIGATGHASQSSATNKWFGSIKPLRDWHLPPNLVGNYNNLDLSLDKKYHPIEKLEYLQIEVEGDVVWAAGYYIVTPVNKVLSAAVAAATNGFKKMLCNAEKERSKQVEHPESLKMVPITSRFDLSWSIDGVEF